MPVVNRRQLRQRVGQLKLRDTLVSTITSSFGNAPVHVVDSLQANLAFSGEAIHQNSWLKINGMELRVASFNAGSGAFVTVQVGGTIVSSGGEYEHHRKLSPADKDRAIDGLVGHLWERKELPINSIDGALHYSIGVGFRVFNAYYFASPTSSLSRAQNELPLGWDIKMTATGRELRLPEGGALGGSVQLILDAQVRATLGASDTATVNIPDEDWVLNGIAARCYETLIADAPGKEAGKYKDLANAYARSFVRDAGRYRAREDYSWRPAFGEFVG